MNSLDLYDFDIPVASDNKLPNAEASSSSSSSTTSTPQPSFNEEVTQVFGQLGKFWGGVRQQVRTPFSQLIASDTSDLIRVRVSLNQRARWES
jgi:hypothetical protein